MKPNVIVTTLCAAFIAGGAVLFAADAPKPKSPTTKPSTTQAKAKTPVNKFCAVEGKGHDIDPKITYEYKGKLIAFCCADCVDEFKKDPEKYVKKME